MARVVFLLVAAAAMSAGCSAETATQERVARPMQTEAVAPPQERPAAAAVVVPDNPADRGIRRTLALAIARDADLQHREISFVVANGDVSVTGVVQTEDERRKFNDLAMSLDGVKSVANALRVAE
jgi:osmotically-inducible protein OsmY